GVVPIYGIGRDERGCLFYAMPLIAGGSLARAIVSFHEADEAGEDPGARRLRFRELLGRLVTACGTIAYAHGQGVVHRDLSPRNVMLGRFDETLVIDWGLAKALGDPDVLGPSPEDVPGVGVGALGEGPLTEPGAIVGTPGFMSPEQARGDHAAVGFASDVFSLGAILYAVLTGRAPFGASLSALGDGEDGNDADADALAARVRAVIVKNQRDGLLIAPRRVDRRVPKALEAVCLKAMAQAPEDRYPTASALAEDLRRWLAGEPVSALAEPIPRRMLRWFDRHRALAATTAVGAAAILLGALAWRGYERRERTRWDQLIGRVHSVLNEAEGHAAAARTDDDPEGWTRAILQVRQAQGMLPTIGGSSGRREQAERALSGRIAMLLAELERERTTVAALEAALLDEAERWGDDAQGEAARVTADAIGRAFRDHGIDLNAATVEHVAGQVRSSPIRGVLLAAIDVRIVRERSHPAVRDRLLAIARAADPDPVDAAIRSALVDGGDVEAARRRARAVDGDESPPGTVVLLAKVLADRGDSDEATGLLRRAARRRPDDFWLNAELALDCQRSSARPPRHEEAARHWTACVALRPASPAARLNLGTALHHLGLLDEAVAEHRRALTLRPDLVKAHHALGGDFVKLGRHEEAVTHLRKAVDLSPEHAHAWYTLGVASQAAGRLEEAASAYRRSAALDPGFPKARRGLITTLLEADPNPVALDEALRIANDLVAGRPDDDDAHDVLGAVLQRLGRLSEAVESFARAVALRPENGTYRHHSSVALRQVGRLDEARAEAERAVTLSPNDVETRRHLGNLLLEAGRREDAAAQFRAGLEGEPGRADLHYSLGTALLAAGRSEEAIPSLRQAAALRPGQAEAHCNLGLALMRTGRYAEALATLTTGHELGSKNPSWRYPSAHWVDACRRLAELEARLPAVLAGRESPRTAAELMRVARFATHQKRLHEETAQLFVRTLAEHPDWARDRVDPPLYHAAACAIMAAGPGTAADPGAPESHRWRARARAWLRDELEVLTERMRDADPGARDRARAALGRWWRDGWLAGVRDAAPLALLGDEERGDWQALWVDAAALLRAAERSDAP
ncbi:MAG: tetratricopeptide repeat protein, partial [Isosphaeraceae bacterium]